MASDPQVLECGIVGAGIAGLGAAIALRRAGHGVEIYEKSTFKSEIGAAISITPNGNNILNAWGFDATRARETPKAQFRLLDSQTTDCQMQWSFEDVAEKFGAAFNAFHRVDMHEEMRRLAIHAGAVFHLGCTARDADCDEGLVRFADGSEVKIDLWVIADGINSRFVDTIAGQHIPSRKKNRDIDKLMADPVARPLFEGQPSGFCVSIDGKIGVFLVTYPCANDTLMNFACFHNTKPHQVDNEHWNSPATVEDVLGVLEGLHPAFSAMAKCADDMKCYVVGHRDVLPRLTGGKVALIGDAAHPMLPGHAQGGCMALEDAAALEVLFANWTAAERVPQRLELFNQLRLPRDAVTQLTSSAIHYNESQESKAARVRPYWDGPVFLSSEMAWSEPIQKFFFGYDAFAEAAKGLEVEG